MRGQEYGVRHLAVDRPQTLEEFLSGLVSLERAQLLYSLGSVYLNGRRETDGAKELQIGDKIRVHLEPRRFTKPPRLLERITENNSDFLIIDKPSGLPVHALVDNLKENLISFLEEESGKKLYVTHRLDVETSGLLVLAKSPEAQTSINAKFQNREWKRTYIALTEKPIEPGPYTHFMVKSPKAPKVATEHETPDSLRCELVVVRCTAVHSLTSTKGRSWRGQGPENTYEHEIQLVTGRTHQIRAQLAAAGAPIVGDRIYGSTYQVRDPDTNAPAIALWAFQIQNRGE